MKYRLYVVFEKNNKVMTREIMMNAHEVILYVTHSGDYLSLLKPELGLSEKDTVHGAIFIGPSPQFEEMSRG